MLKKRIVIFLLLVATTTFGQNVVKPTDEFTVSGQVLNDTSFTVKGLAAYNTVPIPDIVITNHLGERKSSAVGLRGILIRDLLSAVRFKVDNARLLSEFYLVFIANDNYKVVYSWNEIFNSPVGDQLFLLTARDGKSLKDMNERIVIITTSDFKTGRRYIKGLKSIIVARIP